MIVTSENPFGTVIVMKSTSSKLETKEGQNQYTSSIPRKKKVGTFSMVDSGLFKMPVT
jgi:hypothetical protein